MVVSSRVFCLIYLGLDAGEAANLGTPIGTNKKVPQEISLANERRKGQTIKTENF